MARGAALVEAYLEAKRPDDAARELAPMLAERPDDARLLRLGAQVALAQDDAAQAERLCRQAIAADPEEEFGHRLLSVALRRRGRRAEAKDAATAAVRLAPESWRTHAQLAHTGIGLRRERWPEDAAAEAVRLAPGQSQPHAMAGWVQLGRGRQARARGHFRAALAIDPQSGDAQRGLAAASGLGASTGTALRGLAVDPTDQHSLWLLDTGARRSIRLLSAVILALAYAANLAVNPDLSEGAPESVPWLLPAIVAGVPLAFAAWFAYLRRATGPRFVAFLRALPRCLPWPLGPVWAALLVGAALLVVVTGFARDAADSALPTAAVVLSVAAVVVIALGQRLRARSGRR